MDLECPLCLQINEVESEDLPEKACDSVQYCCPNEECEGEMTIGWYAEVEVRSVVVGNDSLDYSLV